MSCDYCTGPDGVPCFPVYGSVRHAAAISEDFQSVVNTPMPPEEWPSNFQPDPECPGFGIYWCPNCGDGKPEGEQ